MFIILTEIVIFLFIAFKLTILLYRIYFQIKLSSMDLFNMFLSIPIPNQYNIVL